MKIILKFKVSLLVISLSLSIFNSTYLKNAYLITEMGIRLVGLKKESTKDKIDCILLFEKQKHTVNREISGLKAFEGTGVWLGKEQWSESLEKKSSSFPG